MAGLEAIFRRPFKEQIAAFRLRLGNLVPTGRWDDVWKAQHDRAFMVAGAVKADLLADLASSVEKAIAEGTTLDEFRRDFRSIVETRGWHGWTGEGTSKGEAWRTRVIYQTNLRTSYMAGRFAQLKAGDFAFWVYRHGPSVEPRLNHLSWDGLVLPPDHPFWAQHYPPNGWGCSCYVLGARSGRGARRLGGDPDKVLPDGWDRVDPRTGEPKGVGKGWGYAPGASVADDVRKLAQTKAASLPEGLAQALLDHAEAIASPDEQARQTLSALVGDFEATQLMTVAEMLAEPLLSTGQKAVIRAYTGKLVFLNLNRALRDKAAGEAPNKDWIRLASLLDDALARLPRHEETAHRGISGISDKVFGMLDSLATGDVVRFSGFTSAARRPEAAFGGEVRLNIVSRNGRSIRHLSQFEPEDEVLFPRGSHFRVVDTTYDDDEAVLTLDLEEIDVQSLTKPPTVSLSAISCYESP